jgi:hypothetical protein
MKKKVHVAVVASGAALFCAFTFALAAWMPDVPSWYHEPVVFPVRVAIWVSGNAHAPSVVAGNVAWVLECLFAGLFADASALLIVHLYRPRPIPDG